MVSRLGELFQIDISVHTVFEAPTVEKLAKALGTRAQADDSDRIAALLQQVEQLTEREVEELLAQHADLSTAHGT